MIAAPIDERGQTVPAAESSSHYAVLGVGVNADVDTIRKSYRRLARLHHPDVAGRHSEERMKRINLAWDVLSDAEKRAEYDLRCFAQTIQPDEMPERRNARQPTAQTARADQPPRTNQRSTAAWLLPEPVSTFAFFGWMIILPIGSMAAFGGGAGLTAAGLNIVYEKVPEHIPFWIFIPFIAVSLSVFWTAWFKHLERMRSRKRFHQDYLRALKKNGVVIAG